ncbi:GNAT family N-acetyltransferase [Schaalia sp. 19OD2882]|uniref:lipid II:glycine glycyltransferase FemX n=1 Tax=Schaalia sp. 19OD2882 TaxID=2794089 RepID=UPI001C1EE3E3|nr:GNAT family N-acetyltransferase [Schaalia sp. 19OD2882]QWW20450.1 GNAT family N-acetyltransferase [Schaalia sp. 19OD2882]
MTETRLVAIDAEAMRIAAAGVVPLPVEQSAPWEAFEASRGNPLWGRFEWVEDGKRLALIALYVHRVRGVKYLWAKWGPVWLKEASPQREAALRADLLAHVRATDSSIAFVRLHAWYSAPDLHDVLQTITYDRTYVIDTGKGDEGAVLAAMTNDGRRTVRKGLKNMDKVGARVLEETEAAAADFSEHWAVLAETAERDGFHPHEQRVYEELLRTMGPAHARVFSVRDEDGTLLCWDLVLVNDRRAQAEYGASTEAARRMAAPIVLDFKVAALLGAEKVDGLDLMGAHSPRVPELYSVGKYKSRFAQHHTDVPGGWEMAVRGATYSALRAAAELKKRIGR